MQIEFAPGFQKSWDKLFSWRYAPLRWFKAVLHFPTDIKWFCQRGWRGWADCDVWSIDWYLLNMLPEMIERLKKTHNGYPAALTDEKWDKILIEIAEGFKRRREWENDYCEVLGYEFHEGIFKDPNFKELYDYKDQQITEQFNRSMELFVKYFWNLWD